MKQLLSVHALIVGAVVSTGVMASESFFISNNRKIPIAISDDDIAVSHRSAVSASGWGASADAQFQMLGVEIIKKNAKSRGDEIGSPFKFSDSAAAVGVLTNEILVRVTPNRQKKVMAYAQKLPGFQRIGRMVEGGGIFLITFSSPQAALFAANHLYGIKGVRYSHPNFMVAKDYRMNLDPYFAKQWYLESSDRGSIAVRDAWAIAESSPPVVTAVLDGGFEVSHPDLRDGLFINTQEIPGNLQDDDKNGYVDDIKGWNFHLKSPDVSLGKLPGHGTAVAGLVSSRANGLGMMGVAPQGRLLPISMGWTPADDALSFYYASNLGASVINASWGYPVGAPATDAVKNAIYEVATKGRGGKGAVIVFAMSNLAQDDCQGKEPDISSLPEVIAVSGSNRNDKKVKGSGYGACMEILAPTADDGLPSILTTDLTGKKGYNAGGSSDLADPDFTTVFGGTSAATPLVSGVISLMLSVNPDLTREEVTALLLSAADKVSPDDAKYDPKTGFSKTYGYGRLNAARAVHAAQMLRRFAKKNKPSPRI